MLKVLKSCAEIGATNLEVNPVNKSRKHFSQMPYHQHPLWTNGLLFRKIFTSVTNLKSDSEELDLRLLMLGIFSWFILLIPVFYVHNSDI